MRLRFAINAKSKSAKIVPSPSVSGVARCLPSGDTIAVWHPPRSAFCIGPSGTTVATCDSSSQAVAFTTKQPDSSAW